MKTIQLSKRGSKNTGYVAFVDDEDYHTISSLSWTYAPSRKTGYALHHKYLSGGRKNAIKKTVSMHRLIMGCPENMVIDHIDGNGLNNQKTNLRICTIAQNRFNSTSVINSTSKYIGVSLHKCKYKTLSGEIKYSTRWLAYITINTKRINLGSFKNEIEAAHARDEAAKTHQGNFANVNIK